MKSTKKNFDLNNFLSVTLLRHIDADTPILRISREFIPDWIKQKPGDWICPICSRPFHREPGPFNYGVTINNEEKNLYLWVQSLGCCEWNQYFPFEKINNRKINYNNLIPIVQEVFFPE